jgi:peptide-methionine (S)-S-oxide reductase
MVMKTNTTFLTVGLLFCMVMLSCGQKKTESKTTQNPMQETPTSSTSLKLATFGSGCFWCTEAIFLQVKGVQKVESGYSGGKVKNPTYKEVCSGLTGHAEVIQVGYDPQVVSYDELLEIFWKTHDPTTLNKQGADEGTQYRSVIYYHDEEQKKAAEFYKEKLDKSGAFDVPIVTEISPFTAFYKAEDYHQNYYNLNGNAPYCSYVIQPKVEKFKKVFADKLKK